MNKTKISTYKAAAGNKVIMIEKGNTYVTLACGNVSVYGGEDSLCGAADLISGLKLANIQLTKNQVNRLTGLLFQ